MSRGNRPIKGEQYSYLTFIQEAGFVNYRRMGLFHCAGCNKERVIRCTDVTTGHHIICTACKRGIRAISASAFIECLIDINNGTKTEYAAMSRHITVSEFYYARRMVKESGYRAFSVLRRDMSKKAFNAALKNTTLFKANNTQKMARLKDGGE